MTLAADTREQLEKFCGRWLQGSGATKAERAVVLHLGRETEILDTVELGAERLEASDLVDMLAAAAQAHADVNATIGRYAVAFSAKGRIVGQRLFRADPALGELALYPRPGLVAGAAEGDGYQDDSHNAAPKHIVKAALRHAEQKDRLATQVLTLAMRQFQTIASQLSDELNLYRDKHLEQLKLVEELISQRHARELESQAEAAKQQRFERMATKLEQLAPMILASLSGASDAVRLVKSLPESVQQGIAQHLEGEQLDLWIKLLKQAEAAEKGAAELAGAGPAGVSAGANGAGGSS